LERSSERITFVMVIFFNLGSFTLKRNIEATSFLIESDTLWDLLKGWESNNL